MAHPQDDDYIGRLLNEEAANVWGKGPGGSTVLTIGGPPETLDERAQGLGVKQGTRPGLGFSTPITVPPARYGLPPPELTDKDFADQAILGVGANEFGFADPLDRPSAASATAQEISRARTPYWQDPDLQSYDHPLRAEETLGQQVGPVAVDQARAELGLPIDYDERPYETLNVAPGEQPGRYSAPPDILSVFGSPGVMNPDPTGADFALSDRLTKLAETNPDAANLFRHPFANVNTIDPDAWNYVNRHDPSTRPRGELAYYDYGIHASQPPPTQGQFTKAELGELIAHELGLHGTVKEGDKKRASPFSNVQAQLEHPQGIDIPGFTLGIPPAHLSRTALRNEPYNPRGHASSTWGSLPGIYSLLHGDISAYEEERELQQRYTDQQVREGAWFTPFGNRDLAPGGKNIGTVRQSLEDRLERMDLEEREAFGPQTNSMREGGYTGPGSPAAAAGLGGWNTRGLNINPTYSTTPMGGSVRNLSADLYGPNYPGYTIGIGNLNPGQLLEQLTPDVGQTAINRQEDLYYPGDMSDYDDDLGFATAAEPGIDYGETFAF